MKLTQVVPFLVQDELLRLGAIFEKKANCQPFSVTDGRLVTGQNPASSTVTAQPLLTLVGAEVVAACACTSLGLAKVVAPLPWPTVLDNLTTNLLGSGGK
jgi:hypothetical protein